MIHIPYTLFLIASIIIWVIYRTLSYKRNEKINISREFIINLFFIYFLIVIYLTFFKKGLLFIDFRNEKNINIIPMLETIYMFKDTSIGIQNSLYNVFGNIILFIPFGFIVPLLYKYYNKLSCIVLYAVTASLTIETIQFFTNINVTDIDDVIFNTFGAILGFIFFNLIKYFANKTKLKPFFDKVSSDYSDNLMVLVLKPIGTILFFSAIYCFVLLYNSTVSGNLSNEDIAQSVFSNINGQLVESSQFFNHKLFLQDNDEYLELQIANEILENRWVNGYSSQLHWNDKSYGYSVEIIRDNDKTGIVVFGKNKDAKTITIKLNGKIYTEYIESNNFFITTFPTYQPLPENTSIANIYNNEKSSLLNISFNEDSGNICNHMKIILP